MLMNLKGFFCVGGWDLLLFFVINGGIIMIGFWVWVGYWVG